VHEALWAEGFAERLTFELTYFSHEIDKGIQARDIQALINACLAAGGTDATLCSPFTRGAGGNLNPPNNFLDNLGSIKTNGVDLKIDWKGNEMSWGSLNAGLQTTYTNKFEAIDVDGIKSQRTVGIEVSDSAIPKIQANMQIGWNKGNWDVALLTRYIDSVDEFCGNALTTNVPGCNQGQTLHALKGRGLQRRRAVVGQGIQHGRPQAWPEREQHLRRGRAGVLQLLAEWIRRGHVRPAGHLLGGHG